jgi:hypothetical protein
MRACGESGKIAGAANRLQKSPEFSSGAEESGTDLSTSQSSKFFSDLALDSLGSFGITDTDYRRTPTGATQRRRA